jgi:hypothetical protein
MPLFRLDPLHPDLLVCETCEAVVCAVPMTPPAEPLDPAGPLTSQQVSRGWPDVAEAVREHAVVCTFRHAGALAGGNGVYVHARERE